jgi:hypothetical protein
MLDVALMCVCLAIFSLLQAFFLMPSAASPRAEAPM